MGAAFTFAAAEEGAEAYPGQPTVMELADKYYWGDQTDETPIFGVAGWPVGLSKSPDIHNDGFAALNIDSIYVPLAIKPGMFPAVIDALRGLTAPGEPPALLGVSVTIPHKEAAFKYVVDRSGKIDDLSWCIGVLNTIVWSGGGAPRGFNSDYEGAIDALAAVTGGAEARRESLAGKRVAMMGAGGAARAIVAGLVTYGAQVVIYNRTRQKADALAEEFSLGGDGKAIAADWNRLAAANADIFINCTPLGMHPAVTTSPLEEAPATWNAETIVFDTVYNPPMTRCCRSPRNRGTNIVPGSEMFLRQAAAQFKAFTGKDAPMDVFRGAMEKA